jgi:CRP-like cAMP-binding protein
VSTKYRIGPAKTETDRRAAFRLRYDVLVRELAYRIPGATAEGGVVEPADRNSFIAVAFHGDEPVATVAIDPWSEVELDPERVLNLDLETFARAFSRKSIVAFRKLVIQRDYRGKDVFWQLIKSTFEFVLNRPAPIFVFLDCMPALMRLYAGLGFRPHAPHFSCGGASVGVPMCLAVNDFDHLARVRSPLLPIFREFGHHNMPEVQQFFRDHEERPLEEFANPELAGFDPHAEQERPRPLPKVPLFRGLGERQILRFLGGSEKLSFAPKDVVIATGDSSTDVFLIQSGYLEVIRKSDSRNILVATLGPGELLGEIGMLLESGRSADVVAMTKAELIRIPASKFRDGSEDDPAVSARINLNLAEILARRLQMTTRMLAEDAPPVSASILKTQYTSGAPTSH